MSNEAIVTFVLVFLATAIPGIIFSSLRHRKNMEALADQRAKLDMVGERIESIKFLQAKRRELFAAGNDIAADKMLEAIEARMEEVDILNDEYKAKYGRQ